MTDQLPQPQSSSASFSLNEGGSVNLTGITLVDPDGGGPATVKVTLSVGHGTLTLAGTSNLTFTAGDGSADTTMTFTGSQDDVAAALAGLSYTSTSDTATADSLSITIEDAVPASAGFPSSLDLSALDGANGFRIAGVAVNDYAGWSVSRAGDVNGDGIADLIVGATGADANGNNSGAAYVVFGRASGGFASNLDLLALNGSTGFRIAGASNGEQAGFSVSSAGDVNGDGIADLIVGSIVAAPNGEYSGAAYVVFGQASGGFASSLDLSALNGSNGFRIAGMSKFDNAGYSVSSAGDVNGDGIADLIVGAVGPDANGANSGAAYVVFGRASGGFASNLDLSALNGANGFRIAGVASYDQAGVSVSSAGDVNGDGIADLIVGARYADANGRNSGAAYVVFGRASGGFASNLDLSALNGANGFSIAGASSGDQAGYSVSSAGDVNGDGIADLIVGAYGANPNGEYSGAAYVVFGQASGGFASNLNLSALNGANGFRIAGVSAYEQAGISVSSAGDVNGDGIDDLIVGASQGSLNGEYNGAAYVVFGRSGGGFPSSLDLSALNGSNGFRIAGVPANDFPGISVSSAGDVNGDGIADLIFGARYANGSGAVYVVYGVASPTPAQPVTTSIPITITAVNDAPVVVAGANGSYTENANGVAIDTTLTLSDPDDTQLNGATVTISAGRTAGDVLGFTAQNGITGSYDSTTGVLTLTGTATLADYQTALRSVTYASTSDNPTATSTTRTISWVVTDANASGTSAASSTAVTSTLTVTPVNDAPVLTAPAALSLSDTVATDSFADQTGTLAASDADTGAVLSYAITGSSAAAYSSGGITYDLAKAGSYGTLYVKSTTGEYAYVADAAAVNALTAAASETFTVAVSDGSLSDSQTLTVNLGGANDAPVLTAPAALSLSSSIEIAGVPAGAVGIAVSSLVTLGGNVTDADSGAVTGIALTGADSTGSGVWYFSTDNGANWTAMTAVSAGNALLLRPEDRLAYVPGANWAGTLTEALSFRAWDQTSGSAGGHVDVTTSQAVSAASGAATLTVVPAAPTGAVDLDASSDHGLSASDDRTNAGHASFTGAGVYPAATVRLYVGSTVLATATADASGAYRFADVDVSAYSGATSFTVRQLVGGQESVGSAALTITFDRSAPTLAITSIATDNVLDGTEAATDLTIAGTTTAEAGQVVTVTLDGQSYTGMADANGAWSVTVGSGALAALEDRSYTVSAAVSDIAGNASQASQTLTVDITAPAAPSLTSATLTGSANPTIAGTAEAGATVILTVGGATYTTTASGGTWSVDLGSATPGAGTLSLNANGTNTVSVTATDAAGNVSAAASQTLTIDTTAPTATVLFEDDSIDALEQSSAGFLITGGEAGAAFTWTITSSGGGQVSGSGVMPAAITRVDGLDLSGLGDGTLTVTLHLTDPAGNASPPFAATTQKLTATPDKPAPVAPPAQQTVDGTIVNGSVTTGTDGRRTTTVTIAPPSSDRQEDTSTPNPDLADVPVVQEQVVDRETGAVSTVTTLTVSVQAGVAVTAAGSAERHSATESEAGLIAAIEQRTDTGSSSRTGLTGGGASFLAALSAQAKLLVRSIDFSAPDAAATGQGVQTKVTGNTLGGTGTGSTAPTAVVLNTTGVNAPMTIQLDNVEFAAVIGNATLVGGDGEQTVYGDANRQYLYLGDGDDELHGGAGDDTVASAGGNDTLYGDEGDDVVIGGEGDDWVLGGEGNDLIGGGTGDDCGFGGTGHDILFGEAGDDTLTGNEGDDTVVGGSGNDLLFGEAGNDFLVGDDGDDTINAGIGNDVALGGAGNDLIGLGEGDDLATGEAGHDTLFGEAGHDTLFGGAGDDLLHGGAGDDVLFADGGADTLWGGEGADLFAFGQASGGAVVMDFQVGVDRLAFYDGTIDLGAVIRSARVEGDNTTLDIGSGDRITILGQTGNVAGWFG